MVLINDKKFACATCIKGHRVSGCTHTDRPLFEVKKKGRPATQCPHCRDKRKNGRNDGSKVHTKCACGDAPAPNVIMPINAASASSSVSGSTQPSQGETPIVPAPTSTAGPALTPPIPFDAETQTRKGQPGSKATFPNGLKDVHEMAQAAEVLSEFNTEEAMRGAELKVSALLNPCKCMSGGPCKCCQPKRERADSLRAPSPSSSGTRTPTGGITDGLVEMFKSKATTSSTPPEGGCCSSTTKPSVKRPSISTTSGATWAQLMVPRDPYLSPDNMHHPAHTSPHVHKTKLYSPYSTSGHSTPKHGHRRELPGSSRGGWASSSSANRPPPPKLRPISDMNTFLGAVFKEDGTLASEIPRSALGLPGIKTFDDMAENGGVKIEAMEVDMDGPISFPTHEDVVIGACTCGDDCECSGCATHGIPPRTGSSDGHHHDHGCGENCKSSFDCSDHLSLPSGITSIGHLLSLAAANVPPPAQRRPADLFAHAHDTRILPPAANVSEDAARSLGLVTLKPLECCNGRCQCAPGQCVCQKECCGCCIRCACDEDGDVRMDRESTARPSDAAASGCCSTDAAPVQVTAPKSCCSTDSGNARDPSPATSRTATPPNGSSAPSAGSSTPPTRRLSPDTAQPTSRQPSPLPPTSSTQPAQVRRASSTSSKTHQGTVARRATVTQGTAAAVHRSASTGKQANKALALHAAPNHPHTGPSGHPRPILPKPQSTSSLGVPKSVNGSRVPSPGGLREPGSSSAHASRDVSPAMLPQQMQLPPHHQSLQLPESAASGGMPAGMAMFDPALSDFGGSSSESSHATNASLDPNVDPGLPDLSEEAIMAFINQFTAEGPAYSDQAPSSDSSLDQALTTPELNFEQGRPFDHFAHGNTADGAVDVGGDDGGMDTEFLAMLTNAMNSSGQQPPHSQQQQQQQHTSQSQQSQQSQHLVAHRQSNGVAAPQPYPQPYSMSSFPYGLESGTRSVSQLGVRSSLDLSIPPAQSNADTGLSISLADLITAQQFQANQRQSDPEPIYRQLPPQSTAFLQQVLGQNPSFTAGTSGTDAGLGSSNGPQPGNGNGNMIDLSKPLNASDVERILRALQDQQAAQAAQAGSATQVQPSQGPGPQKYHQPPPGPVAPPVEQQPPSQSGSHGPVENGVPRSTGPAQRLSNQTADFPFGPGAHGFGPMAYGSQELMNRYMIANGLAMGQSQDAVMGVPMPMPAAEIHPNGMMGYGVHGMPDMGDADNTSGGWNGLWTAQEANPHAGQGMVEAMKRGAGV